MSDGITIQLVGEADLLATLSQAIQRLDRPRELLDNIGALLESNVQLRFETKTAPDGSRWRPLAPSTVERYRAQYKGSIPGSLLERTRHMRNSLTHNATDDYVDVGFGDRIAGYHEFGTVKMPARRLLTADPEAGTLGAQDRQDVLEEINAYLARLI